MRAAHGFAQHLLSDISKKPAYSHEKSSVEQIRRLGAGDGPHPIEQLIARFDESVVRPGLLPSHPGHLAYIPGGGLYASSLADYLAAVTNEYAGVRFVGPGSVEMEDMILDWMARVVGFPSTADGNLASGGSIASLTAIVAAREAAGLRARDFDRAVVYATPHIHQCLHKAIRVAGMGETVRRDVPVDEGFRMCPRSLSELVASDRAQGLRPWLVLGSAGTADTGAIDPLDRIADICRREGLWFHVDAAYGGFFALLDEFRPRLAGLERADSLVLDPHKSMFLPYGTGAVLVPEPRCAAGRARLLCRLPAGHGGVGRRRPLARRGIAGADQALPRAARLAAAAPARGGAVSGVPAREAGTHEVLPPRDRKARLRVGAGSGSHRGDLPVGAGGRQRERVQPGAGRRNAPRWPGIPVVHNGRRQVHVADGGAGVSHASRHDRFGARGAARGGRTA